MFVGWEYYEFFDVVFVSSKKFVEIILMQIVILLTLMLLHANNTYQRFGLKEMLNMVLKFILLL